MNILDIAREAGVSIATVSRVINKPDVVTDETRRRVERIIETHGYTPNALARGLLTSRSSTIGVLTVDLLNPYYATVVHSIERNLATFGYNSFLCNTGDDRDEKERYIKTLLEKRVEGLVFVGSIYAAENGVDIMRNAARSVPTVLVNSLVEAPNVYCLLCDDAAGVTIATEHLLSKGRRTLLFINTLETASAQLKERAFLQALSLHPEAQHGIVETSDHALERLATELTVAFRERRYDGVIATDDLFANIALSVLRDTDRNVPEEVSVIGYNNSNVSELSLPKLTSVDSRMEDLGRECAVLLDSLLSGKEVDGESDGATPEPVRYLEPRLVEKRST